MPTLALLVSTPPADPTLGTSRHKLDESSLVCTLPLGSHRCVDVHTTIVLAVSEVSLTVFERARAPLNHDTSVQQSLRQHLLFIAALLPRPAGVLQQDLGCAAPSMDLGLTEPRAWYVR